MCTRCPVPCQECRAGGTGAFCGKTPCGCQCHDPRRARESLDAHAAGYAAAVADVVAWMRKGNLDDCRAADEIEDGYAVGAAKKGAT